MKKVSALVLVFAIANVILAAVSGFGVRMDWWGYSIGFSLLKTAVGSGLAIGGMALILLTIGLVKNLHLQRMVLPALILAGLTAAVPYIAEREFRKVPTYGNATTNFANSPEFVFLAEERVATVEIPPLFTTDEAEELQHKYFPDLQTISVKRSTAEVAQVTRQLLVDMGLNLAPSMGGPERVEATATSFWFGFKDDVAVILKPLPDNSTLIDVRSASRVGRFDGGANASRVKKILASLQKE